MIDRSTAMHLYLSLKGMEMIFRISIALLELHQDELMLLSMEEMLKVTFWTSVLKEKNG